MNRPEDRPARPAHQIRLDSQWDLEQLATSERDPSAGEECRATNPSGTQRLRAVTDWPDAVGGDYQGPLWLLRRFGRPTGLGPHDRVDLIVTALPSASILTLNRHVLRSPPTTGTAESSGQPRLFRCDVSSLLEDRNLLSLELNGALVARRGVIPGNVSLEITSI